MFIEINKLLAVVTDFSTFLSFPKESWERLHEKNIKIAVITSKEENTEFIPPYFYAIKMGIFFQETYIWNALKKLETQPYETVYVSSSKERINQLIEEPIGTIWVTKETWRYDEVGRVPDFKLKSIEEILGLEVRGSGYFSELFLTRENKRTLYKRGRVIHFPLNVEGDSFYVLAGGRFFSKNHVLHNIHQLSNGIIKSKWDNSQDSYFSDTYYKLVKHIQKQGSFDGITRVPPRTFEGRDRFSNIVISVCNKMGLKDYSDQLFLIEEYESQKSLPKKKREHNISGKFAASDIVRNKSIILIDDVLTTGATVKECIRTLVKQGAKSVTVVVLGVNQYEFNFRQASYIACSNPSCSGYLIPRMRKDGTEMFFGCTNYKWGETHSTMSFLKGWQAINENNRLEEEEDFFF